MNRREMMKIAGAGAAAAMLGRNPAQAAEAEGGKLDAVWVHGTSFQPEDTSMLTAVQRVGWGTSFSGKPGKSTWFHVSIPTPVVIDDKRPVLERVFVLYKTNGASIRSVHVYDGVTKVRAFDDLMLKGDLFNGLFPHNTWQMSPPLQLRFGLGISIGVTYSVGFDSAVTTEILFTTAGADFRTARSILGSATLENVEPMKKVRP